MSRWLKWGALGAGLILAAWIVLERLWLSPVVTVPVTETPLLDEARKKMLKEQLSPEAYRIVVNKGTEPPFSSPLNAEKRPGTYVAADTGEPVFRSEDKFDSGTGWPSFTRPITPEAILTQQDNTLFVERTEVLSRAGGHLGHVFPDGPPPTGLRYCINGLALRFVPDEAEQS